jgi:cold shock CspA family protein
MERPPSKPARASSRGQRASGDAAEPPPVADGWWFGTIERFNQISLTGTIVFIGDKGSEEVPISSAAFRKSGLTNLFSGQHVEALIETRSEGRREIVELKLSVESRRMEAIRENPHAVLAERPVRSRYFG